MFLLFCITLYAVGLALEELLTRETLELKLKSSEIDVRLDNLDLNS